MLVDILTHNDPVSAYAFLLRQCMHHVQKPMFVKIPYKTK